MKIGVRKPSIKKSIKARTTGKAKRAVKKAIIPGYGKKGMGWVKNPKKAAYNKIYNKTTVSIKDLIKDAPSSSTKSVSYKAQSIRSEHITPRASSTTYSICGAIIFIFGIILVLLGILLLFASILGGLIAISLGVFFIAIGRKYKKISKELKQSANTIEE